MCIAEAFVLHKHTRLIFCHHVLNIHLTLYHTIPTFDEPEEKAF